MGALDFTIENCFELLEVLRWEHVQHSIPSKMSALDNKQRKESESESTLGRG